MNHWIILPIVFPALSAAVLLLPFLSIWQRRALSLVSLSASVGLVFGLLSQATELPPQPYALGNWPAPFGIYLVLDRLSAMMLALTASLALLMTLYAIATRADEAGRHFHSFVQFLLMGLSGAFLTADAFNLFVFFEVLLIASYGLMVHGGGGARTRAGVQYVAFNLLGSSVFLIALATFYSVMGTLNMADLARRLPDLAAQDAWPVRIAAVLLLFVFAVKAALAPLHLWLPTTYANAPAVVAGLFAIMTKVGVYAVLRFGSMVFPPDLVGIGPVWADLLWPAALLTMAVGAIGALGSASLMRMAAFAGIASTGTIILAIQPFTPQTTAAALFYLVHSTLATAVLFLIADQVMRARSHGDVTIPAGRLSRHGLLSALFFGVAIAVVGLPPLSGFIGKLLVMQALGAGAVWSWVAILLVSFALMIAFARVGSLIFWKTTDAVPLQQEPRGLGVIFFLLGLLLVVTLAGGVMMDWFMATAIGLHDPTAFIDANALQPKD